MIKFTIEKNIKRSSLEKDIVVEYLKAIGDKFKKFDKSQKAYYLSLLDNTQYDGAFGVWEHIIKLVNYYNKLKSYSVDLGESFLAYHVLQYLPFEYVVLKATYKS